MPARVALPDGMRFEVADDGVFRPIPEEDGSIPGIEQRARQLTELAAALAEQAFQNGSIVYDPDIDCTRAQLIAKREGGEFECDAPTGSDRLGPR